jgi:predicted dehydrogenase
MRLRYALIGCGRISPNHIAAAIENSLEITALCDIVTKNMEDKIIKFHLPENTLRYTNYKEMLEKEKLDVVAIATESGKHAQIALDCIAAGCNLIIEKPISLSLADADAIIKNAKEKGVKVCACHQNRFNKSIIKIREAIETERFGRLFHGSAHIRWNRNESYYKQASWRGTWEQDGGALMNQCIHNIDLLRWMMGDNIELVIAMTDNLNHDYIETEDFGIALIRFANGSYGVIEGTTNVFPNDLEETLYICGEKGTIKAGGKSINTIDEWHFADETEDSNQIKTFFQEDPPNVYGYGHYPLYKDVINAIENDRQPLVNAEAGRRAIELVLAIYESAASGACVRLPLKQGSTLDYKGRFRK